MTEMKKENVDDPEACYIRDMVDEVIKHSSRLSSYLMHIHNITQDQSVQAEANAFLSIARSMLGKALSEVHPESRAAVMEYFMYHLQHALYAHDKTRENQIEKGEK